MSDSADEAAEFQARHNANAVARQTNRLHCARVVVACVECGDELTAVRHALGACRCVECQDEHERRERHYARRGG